MVAVAGEPLVDLLGAVVVALEKALEKTGTTLMPASFAAAISASHHFDAKKPSLSAATTSRERFTASAIAAALIVCMWLRCVVGLKTTFPLACRKADTTWNTSCESSDV